ncbi:entry exclusion protein, partial [Klebsiella quasipneumoniae]|nr:entry exclusion protein [Klebsiella quasipneumoniae]
KNAREAARQLFVFGKKDGEINSPKI